MSRRILRSMVLLVNIVSTLFAYAVMYMYPSSIWYLAPLSVLNLWWFYALSKDMLDSIEVDNSDILDSNFDSRLEYVSYTIEYRDEQYYLQHLVKEGSFISSKKLDDIYIVGCHLHIPDKYRVIMKKKRYRSC